MDLRDGYDPSADGYPGKPGFFQIRVPPLGDRKNGKNRIYRKNGIYATYVMFPHTGFRQYAVGNMLDPPALERTIPAHLSARTTHTLRVIQSKPKIL